MLYLAYILVKMYVLPAASQSFLELVNGLGPIIIIILGISLLLGAGVFGRLLSTMAEGSMNIVIIVIGAVFRAIGAFLRWFLNLIPTVYTSVSSFCRNHGRSQGFSTCMGLITSIVVIAIIL